MSRLFDALKEATRFRENNAGTAGEGVWEALGIREMGDTPSVSDRPEVQASAATSVLIEEESAATPDQRALDADAPPATEFHGNQAAAVLDKKARIITNASDEIVVERYRMLRTKIMQERDKKSFKSLVVASASPQEGKTVTVLNLALSFAMLPAFKVLVVDGDMRRGTLGEWLGVDDSHVGLSNLLDGSAKLEDVILKSSNLPMHFIMRGNSLLPDLHASHFSNHFRKIAEHYDLVLVDSPPVNALTDVQLLAASTDAVLLIARAFSTTRKALEQAMHHLKPFRMIGCVLNAGSSQRAERYHGYY